MSELNINTFNEILLKAANDDASMLKIIEMIQELERKIEVNADEDSD